VRNNNVGALHYNAADHDQFRIVCMNKGRHRPPQHQTAVADRNGDLVFTSSFFKKLLESNIEYLDNALSVALGL
jgi:hypothetical protein